MVKQQLQYALVLIVLLQANGFAQTVRATARVDSNNVLIGDWIRLYVEVEYPANVSVVWPLLPDSLEGFEIVQRQTPSPKRLPGGTAESATFILTAFDSGTRVIPALPFSYAYSNDTLKRTTLTEPIPIFVHSIPIDTTHDIKDVKPPLSVPVSFAEILPYLVGLLGAAGLAWAIRYVTRRRRKGESLLPESPPRPPDEIALEALQALEAEHLWQRGKVKEYHSQLTDIIRLYVGRRFDIIAMEMTTDEILSSCAMAIPAAEAREQLKEILVRADLVKFAKFQPTPHENERSFAMAVAFVESTRHRVPEVQSREFVTESKI